MNIVPSFILDHLWQSTLFAAMVALSTLVLRTNRARVRQWLWFVASVKFLVPFSVLIALGSQVAWKTTPLRPPAAAAAGQAVGQMIQPFSASLDSPALGPAAAPDVSILPAVLFVVWAVGAAGFACGWLIRWRQYRRAVSNGTSVAMNVPLRVVCSPTQLEPGIFGVFRPVLLLPEGIFDRLTPAQLQAILAHELCHVRHRDNLLAAIQMFVETVFWFHPLVWWIGKRMVEERERACDEEVVRRLGEPQTYVEGILTVCKLYIESPLRCASGITGAQLQRRIEAIMGSQATFPVNFGKKMLLGTVGAAAILLPVFAGAVFGPALRAQAPDTARPVFTVASIKANEALSAIGAAPRVTGNQVRWRKAPLPMIVLYAYRIPATRLSGKVSFDDAYDIEAIAEGSPTEEQLRLMFRALLEDRFGIKVHWETREMELSRLVIARGGAKLKRAEEDSSVVISGNSLPWGRDGVFAADGLHLAGHGATTEQIANSVGTILRRPVLDQTGLTGTFDYDVKFRREDDLSNTSLDPFIQPALQDALGLRVESGKGPIEVLVVDRIDKPTEN